MCLYDNPSCIAPTNRLPSRSVSDPAFDHSVVAREEATHATMGAFATLGMSMTGEGPTFCRSHASRRHTARRVPIRLIQSFISPKHPPHPESFRMEILAESAPGRACWRPRPTFPSPMER